jgi:DNA-binding LacI/PurR family transcriptional regulator
MVCDTDQAGCSLVTLLRNSHPDLDVITDAGTLRPSFLNQFSAVIVLSQNVPDSFIRDLVVRNVAVVAVGDEPRAYSTHAVIIDIPLAVSLMARDLLLAGHRRIGAVESSGSCTVANMIRQVAARCGSDAVVETCYPHDAHCLVEHGVTAFLCESLASAAQVKDGLEKRHLAVPRDASVVAVGCQTHDRDISGYYTTFAEKAQAILTLLQQNNARPTTLWLSGKFIDCHTMAPLTGAALTALHPDAQSVSL